MSNTEIDPLSRKNLTATVILGAILGAVFGIAGAITGFESTSVGVFAGGITGVVVAVFLGTKRANPR